jgi:hypothetical protein
MTDDVGIAHGGVRVATLWRRGIEKNSAQMQEDDARKTRKTHRCFRAAHRRWVTHSIDGHALPTWSHRLSRGSVNICVLCVHLHTSALKFFLCSAADGC